MSDIAQTISDADLLKKLQESYIKEDQKKELEPLIPEMTNEEKEELISLINQSQAEGDKAQEEYQKGIGELNKEYKGKMDQVSKKFNETALKEMEKIDTEGSKEDLKELDGTIASMQTQQKEVSNEIKKEIKKKSHAVRNLILILLFLILVAGGGLYTLSQL